MEKTLLKTIDLFENDEFVIVERYFIQVEDGGMFHYSVICEMDRDIKNNAGDVISSETLDVIII